MTSNFTGFIEEPQDTIDGKQREREREGEEAVEHQGENRVNRVLTQPGEPGEHLEGHKYGQWTMEERYLGNYFTDEPMPINIIVFKDQQSHS